MQYSPTRCHLVALGPKYPPQHPQSMLLQQCHRPSFTPIKKKAGEIIVTIRMLHSYIALDLSVPNSHQLTISHP